MKLGFCLACKDIFKLVFNVRECHCGKSSGVLKGRELAKINGPIKILGINDKSLYEALEAQPSRGSGKDFIAFVLPKINKSVEKISRSNEAKLPADRAPERNVYLKPIETPEKIQLEEPK